MMITYPPKLAHYVLCVFFLIIDLSHAAPRSTSDQQYVAVIDAGSSGSRLYLYRVPRSIKSGQIQDTMKFENNAPALANFKLNPSDAGIKAIAPLLEGLSNYLSTNNIQKTDVEVNVLATGGMRLLDDDIQQSIFNNVKKYIMDNSFPAGVVATISGKMEGVYSWADVNYLLGKFNTKTPTIGIVEIGGASAQVAFETNKPIGAEETITINSKNYRVFVSSFLGLGRNEARKSMVKISSSKLGFTPNPCYPRDIIGEDEKADTHSLSGDFNYPACKKIYENVLANFNLEPIRKYLSIGTVTFAAVGTGNPVGTVWGLLEAWKSQSKSPSEISKQAQANCDRSWMSFETEYGGASFNKSQCADSVFVSSLLYGQHGLKFNRDAVTSFKLIDNATPTWTRGVIVLKYLK